MSLKILGIGTAVPPTAVPQAVTLQIARAILRPTPIQDAWLTTLFTMTGIKKRHFCLGPEVLRDVAEGTNNTGSAFVPASEEDRGPSTGQRMADYVKHAIGLAARRGPAGSGAVRPDRP